MDGEDEGPPSEALLADRLARLAERRRATERRHRRSSSSDEAEARMPPRCSAVQALRELLEGRGAALEGGVQPGGDETDAWQPRPGAASAALVQTELDAAPSRSQSAMPDQHQSGDTSAPSSMPPTARNLITVAAGLGRQAAAGERQQRAAELCAADAAVRDAEMQRAELDAMLLRQRAAEAQRERQRAERAAELARIQGDLAAQHMAAWRITRAWQCFLASPGRLQQVAAATRLQAAWRSWATRRRFLSELQKYRQRRSLLAALHAAVGAGELAVAREAAEQLGQLGAGPQAAQQVAGLEKRAADAERALRAMAARGGAEAYRTAAAATQRYRHLEAALREAASLFASRVAAAEAAVNHAAEGGPLLQFKEAVASAAALGVDAAFLARAEQFVTARNQEVGAALQAALEAAPFDSQSFGACLARAQRCGLHADAARAQRGLQLRKHRAAGMLQQLAVQGSAAELEVACRDAAQLGLEAEAEGALSRLEHRQAAATEELRQAAFRGSLAQYEAAAAAATVLQVSAAVQVACREQVQRRQQEAEQQLRLAAAGHADMAAVRKRCQVAAALGLAAAVRCAEVEVQRRREAAVEQLVSATQEACRFATSAAKTAQKRGDGAAAAMCASPRDTPWKQLLSSWLAAALQLLAEVQGCGAAAALLHPPATCSAWPAELRGWLMDAHLAAGLELHGQVLAAAGAFHAHLQALHTAAQVAVMLLQPVPAGDATPRNASASKSRLGVAGGAGSGRESARAWDAQAGCRRSTAGGACGAAHALQQHTPRGGPGASHPKDRPSAEDEQLMARFWEWRAVQEHLLPLVAGVADRAEGAAEAEVEPEAQAGYGEEGVAGSERSLDMSTQGLSSLQALPGSGTVQRLNLSGNSLASIESVAALHALRELHISGNQLQSLAEVQALGRLTYLDASHNRLASLPSLTGLPSLRHLNLSANCLTPAALAVAGFQSGACAQLTSLSLAGNQSLGELQPWMGPLPSLLRLDVSSCGLASLAGLGEAAPVLQVLAASDNLLTSLPPSLGLPLLRELWLGCNRLEAVPAWPWLPSLRELHLRDNQLTAVAPLQGFPCLQVVDLSFNRLSSLATALASLAQLRDSLEQLRLNDNPWQWHGQREALHPEQQLLAENGDEGGSYAAAVLSVLPGLKELDSQPLCLAQRAQRVQAAARRRGAVGAAARAAQAWRPAGGEWDARTLLWAVTQPDAAGAVHREALQQQAMAVAHVVAQTDALVGPVEPGAAALAEALASLKLAAAAEPADASQAPAHCGSADGTASSGTLGSGRSGGVRRSADAALAAQRQYLLLAAGQLSAAQAVVLVNPGHYRRVLGQVERAATAIQACWRGFYVRTQLHRWLAEQRAAREEAAAVCVQAAWRGWACRQRRAPWVQHRLVIWRHQWREAQRQVAEHQQQRAATRIQAVWRGWRVRRLLALARMTLELQRQQERQQRRQQQQQQQQQLAPAAQGTGDGLDPEASLELELSGGSVDALLEGAGSAVFGSPEVLQPELLGSSGWAGSSTGPVIWAQPGASSSLGSSAALLGGGTLFGEGSAVAAYAAAQQQSPAAAALSWPPAEAGSGRGGGGATFGLDHSSPPARPASPGALSGGAGGEWEFSDPATAAAFAQLRQRRQSVARRREVQQHRKDPMQRLQHFQGKQSPPACLVRSGSGSSGGGAVATSPRGSLCGGGKLHTARGTSGGKAGSPCSLPALRSPQSPGCSQPVSPAGAHGLRGSCIDSGGVPATVCAPRPRHAGPASSGRQSLPRGSRAPVRTMQLFETL